MKKLVLGTIAALVATVSLSNVAEAGWHHHHGWNHGWNGGFFFGGPQIVIGTPVYDDADYCFVKKVRRYDDFGNMYVKRVRVCR